MIDLRAAVAAEQQHVARIGNAAVDRSTDAADVALMADDLTKVIAALDFGQKARSLSAQNIALSIAVLVAMIPLAVVGLIGVATAVVVHELAELLAVANGLRAGRLQANDGASIGRDRAAAPAHESGERSRRNAAL